MPPKNPGIPTKQEAVPKLMTFEEYSKIEHETPYVFTCENKSRGKEIVYFGVSHSHNPTKDRKMFGDIQHEFEKQKPDIVLVEGVPQINEYSTERINEAKEKLGQLSSLDPIIEEHGESGFALALAIQNNVEVRSPEPNFTDEITSLERKGFSREDIFAFYVYRQLFQFNNTPKIEDGVANYMQKNVFQDFEKIGWKDFDLSLNHANTILKKVTGKENLVYTDTRLYEIITDPAFFGDAQDPETILNKIARESNYFRNTYMLKKIHEILKKHNKVFVVYGASHAVMQEKALRSIIKS